MDDDFEPYYTPRQCKAYIDRIVSPLLEEADLTYSNAPFIREISKNPGVSMKGLCEIMMCDKALTTRTVTVLVSNGYVEDRG